MEIQEYHVVVANIIIVISCIIGGVFAAVLYKITRSTAFLIGLAALIYMIIDRIVLTVLGSIPYQAQLVLPFWILLDVAFAKLYFDLKRYYRSHPNSK